MAPEKTRLYSLDEAKIELNKAECARFGHSFEIFTPMGQEKPAFITCSRCGRSWTVGDERDA